MASRFFVFISHVSEDETIAVNLKNYIERIFLNAEVFVSGKDLRGGDIWVKEIKEKLEKSSVIISIISNFSFDSNWVMFESGAGFIDNKTIPICISPIRVSSLKPPLSLLQSRNYDINGLTMLMEDIANKNELRLPKQLPNIEKEIEQITEFLELRDENQKPKTQPSVVQQESKINSFLFPKEDESIVKKVEEIEKKYKTHLLNYFSKVDRKVYDIPSEKEIMEMSIAEIYELAKYANLPVDLYLTSNIMFLRMNLPKSNDAKWKKMNAYKSIESVEKDIIKLLNEAT